jgi:fructose-1,6-bisphosphatase-3
MKFDLPYLKLLAQQFPTIESVAAEIIHLSAIKELPKITEHFMSDIHGEYEALQHVLRNGSGSIRLMIDKAFGYSLHLEEKQTLATLIYYPERKLALLAREHPNDDYKPVLLVQLITLTRLISNDFTRLYVRKRLPEQFSPLIEELLYRNHSAAPAEDYEQTLLNRVVSTGMVRPFIVALADLIKALTIGHLHIIGDVYDRGPGAHLIMDELMKLDAIDFQWGNHDIVWMGAAAGSDACIANVIRVSLRYANMETLENGYAISMIPLASFAMEVYGDDDCSQFKPRGDTGTLSKNEKDLMAKMHKAITIIQFKLEGQIIQRCPYFEMESRLLLDKLNLENGTISISGKEYRLRDKDFQTVDSKNPYQLTPREREVVDRLRFSFVNSSRLQRHVRYLITKGSLYLVHDRHLLYHGCIPMTLEGSFHRYKIDGQEFNPKEFMDYAEKVIRKGFHAQKDGQVKQSGRDMMWYLWSGAASPLYGKDKMATFERYFVKSARTHREKKNPYYKFRDKRKTARTILEAFGLNPDTSTIVNGHVPVKVNKGESPVKAGGRLLVIDGGFAKAYQNETGIAGYTLIDNPDALILMAHSPFLSKERAIREEIDLISEGQVLETYVQRQRVKDTDLGGRLHNRIDELAQLLKAYRTGILKEE